MAQHDYTIANQGFPATRADINNALSAIATNNSGTTAPSTQYAGQFWIDTTASTWTLYIHDGTDDIQFATIDTSANTVNFIDSALDVVTDTTPQLGGMLDVNGQSIGDGTLELIKFSETASAVNEITVTNAATTAAPEISATGDDTNIDLRLNTKGTGGVVFNTGAVATPSITTSGDTNTGIFFPAADTIAFTEGGTEAMRITSNGRVGIGTSSPVSKLEISDSVPVQLNLRNTGLDNNGEIVCFQWNNDADFTIQGRDSNGVFKANWYSITSTATDGLADEHIWYTGTSAERMRITSTGDLLVGKTATGIGTAGNEFKSYGEVYVTRNNQNLGLFNRLNGDGQLFGFMHDSITEGTISISGATVAYSGFTGTHWSRFIDESKPDVLRGTVMESLDQMTDWYHAEFETSYTEKDADGNDVVKTIIEKKPYALKANEQEGNVITYNWNTEKKDEEGNDIIEQVQATIVKQLDVKHVMSKISDTVEAKNVYGVFSAWDNDDLINNDFYVASVGSFVVRIKAGQVVAKGDLLQSNGDGTAKVQADDIIRASTFAKVLSNTVIETYEDGSFIVPCSLMC
jgi:hypothetical protein